MKIRFVTEGSINEYWESSPPCDCDVLLILLKLFLNIHV